jgi:3-isopropylmalate/(R)-2-methylmalate dehydratase large subunit
VLATQTLIQRKSKNMRAVIDGTLPPHLAAKDVILAIIGEIGAAGGIGHALEFSGEAICAFSMEGPHDPLQHVGRAGCKDRHHCT